jgi:hypothetical protein
MLVHLDVDVQLGARKRDRVAERLARGASATVEAVERQAATARQLHEAEILVVPAVGDVKQLVVEAVAAEELRPQLLGTRPARCCTTKSKSRSVAERMRVLARTASVERVFDGGCIRTLIFRRGDKATITVTTDEEPLAVRRPRVES